MDEISSQIWHEEFDFLGLEELHADGPMNDQMTLEELHADGPMPWEDEDMIMNNDKGRDKGKDKKENCAEEVNDNKKAKCDEGEPKCDEDAKEKANRDKNANDNNLEAQVLNLVDKAAKGDENKEATHVWWCPTCGASPSYYCATDCDGQKWIPKLMIDGKTKEESKQKPNHPKGYSKRKSSDALE